MGTHHLRARFYSPAIGRFLQEDTYYGDGLNLYSYCQNNPVKYVDPSGHNGCPKEGLMEGKEGPKGSDTKGMGTADEYLGNENHKRDLNLIPDTYDGVKKASEYLKKLGLPRNVRKDIIESFDIRTIKVEQAGSNTYGLRFYGGNAKANGPYLFETFTQQTNRANLALPPEWNSMTGIKQWKVMEGTTIFTGNAAPQFQFGSQYIGGRKTNMGTKSKTKFNRIK